MIQLLIGLWALLLSQVLLRTRAGRDFQSDVMGGAHLGAAGTSTTAPTATTFTTDGNNFAVDSLVGKIIVPVGSNKFGVILSNTSAAASVLTVDRWHTAGDPDGAAAATPAAGAWIILPGGMPAFFMAVTENNAAPLDADTALTGELTSGGFARARATYAHTSAVAPGGNTYTLTKTFTSSDGTTRTPAKIGILNARAGGRMVFETAIPSPPAMVSGDSVAITDTVTL